MPEGRGASQVAALADQTVCVTGILDPQQIRAGEVAAGVTPPASSARRREAAALRRVAAAVKASGGSALDPPTSDPNALA